MNTQAQSRETAVTAASLIRGGRYNWRHQPERLIYMGARHYPGDRRTWHQFARVEAPTVCWSEVLDTDLSSFEESTVTQSTVCPSKSQKEMT